MKVKVVGKEKFTKKETGQVWTSFQCVSDMKCSDNGGPTFGGVKVLAFMCDYKPTHDNIKIGETYTCVTEENFYKGALQSRIVDLI